MVRKHFEELRNSGQLPSPSGIGLRILCLTQADDWAIEDIVQTIQSDPALTGRVLRVANSATSGSGEPIGTAHDASIRLGIRAITNLALGFTLVAGNRSGRCAAFDYHGFWSDSLARAVASEAIAKLLDQGVPSEAFTAGLLSRLGELALASVHPTDYGELLEVYRADPSADRCELESERFEIDSREVTAAMVADWGLPEHFFDSLSYFHLEDGEERTEDMRAKELMSILRMAAIIARFSTSDQRNQIARWPEMEMVRYELGMKPTEFSMFCKRLGEEWKEWGRCLEIETSSLPSLEHVARMSSRTRTRERPKDDGKIDLADKFRQLRILAVDDESTSLKLLESHLRKAGHEVVTARDGKEALATTLEWNPHVVVSDWMMPTMDGIELCLALRRAQRAGRGVYFLLVTGRGEEERIVEAFDSGIDDYVTKPFNPKILLARVRAGLRLVNLREQVDREHQIQAEATSKLGVLTRKLRNTALTDPLTGIPNRRYGLERLEEEWCMWKRKAQPFSVVAVDVDHFKRINDKYGHDVGDVVLTSVAGKMRDTLRSVDILVRTGGEEFLVLCPDTDAEGAKKCAERLREDVAQTLIRATGFQGSVTISLGVAEADATMTASTELLKRADEAVYRAKALGRNRFVCWSDLSELPESA